MTFAEAQAQLIELQEQQRAGALTAQAFADTVNSLRVLDAQQRWWQPDPAGNGWLCWNGTAWQAAVPPELQSVLPPDIPPLPPDDAPATATEPAGETAPAETGPADSIPATEPRMVDARDFLTIARQVPVGQRPESWWNALSIFGGAISGYLWFVYGSVSGLPTPAFLSGNPFTGFTRLLMPLAMLALPFFMLYRHRQRSINALCTLQNRFMRLGPAGLIAIIALLGAIYYFFPHITEFAMRVPFIARILSFNRSGEGLDFITPVIMLMLPIGFMLLRRPIDRLLALLGPLQRIPASLRLGIGLAIPFLTAFILYHNGYREYPLLRANVLLGTVLSYLVMRTPQTRAKQPPAVLEAVAPLLILALLAIWALAAAPACADDFLRDPFNLNDGLRTDGIAPIIAGVSTAVITILINGVQVAQQVLKAREAVKEGETAERKNFVVIVETKGADGLLSLKISDDLMLPLFFYAHCQEEGHPFPAGDPTLMLAPTLNADWVRATEEPVVSGRCWRVHVPTPLPQTPQPDTVELTVTAGQSLISASVTLKVTVHPKMVVEAKEWQVAEEFAFEYAVFQDDETDELDAPVFDDIKIYWVKPEDPTTPVKPDFTPQTWKITADPDYLDFDTPVQDADGLIWRADVRLKPGIVFNEGWLESNGVIQVQVEMHALPNSGN